MKGIRSGQTIHSRVVPAPVSTGNEAESSSRLLIIAVLHQAIKDYLYVANAATQCSKVTAHGFLFNDEYRVDWGDKVMSPSELLGEADIDISWLRDKIIAKQAALPPNPRYNKGEPLL